MSDTFDPHHMATLLIAAHQNLEPISTDKIGGGPTTIDEVNIIQAEVMRAVGPAGGFKTAYPDGDAAQIMAPIPKKFIRPSPAHYDANEMRLYGIEIEIAFRIDRELPLPEDDDFENRLRAAVSVVPAIEMVDSRLADREGAAGLLKLADNQTGFGLVVGEPISVWSDLDLVAPAVTFTVNGEQLGSTSGTVPGGVSAFEVLKGMVANIGEHCGGLAPGHYVTTGALSGLFWTEKGARVSGSIEGIGDVAVTIGD